MSLFTLSLGFHCYFIMTTLCYLIIDFSFSSGIILLLFVYDLMSYYYRFPLFGFVLILSFIPLIIPSLFLFVLKFVFIFSIVNIIFLFNRIPVSQSDHVKENTKRNGKSHGDCVRELWSPRQIFEHKNKNRYSTQKALQAAWEQALLEKRQKAARRCAMVAIRKKMLGMPISQSDSTFTSNLTTPDIDWNLLPFVVEPSGSSNIIQQIKQTVENLTSHVVWPHFSLLIPNFIIIFRNYSTDTVSTVAACYNIVNYYSPPQASLAVGIILACILSIFPSRKKKQDTRQATSLAFTDEVQMARDFLGQQELSPFRAMGTLVFVFGSLFFLKKIATKNDFDSFFNRVGKLPQNLVGVASLFTTGTQLCNITSEYFNFRQGIESPSYILEQDLKNLYNEIRIASLRENQELLRTSLPQVSKIDLLYQQSLLLSSRLTNGYQSSLHRTFHTTITALHRLSLTSPARGSKIRTPPIVIQLFGEPGVGKTRLVSPLSIDIINTIDPSVKSQFNHHIYYRKTGEKFWTNYNASQHYVCVIDDANQIDPKFQESIPFCGELIHLANSSECPLPVAEVENKAFAYFNSRAIITTNNIRTPNLDTVLTCPTAYYRRIDYDVEVLCKPEFSYEFSGLGGRKYYRFDPLKVSPNNLNLESYLFNVYVPGTSTAIKTSIDYNTLKELICSSILTNATTHSAHLSSLQTYAESRSDFAQMLPNFLTFNAFALCRWVFWFLYSGTLFACLIVFSFILLITCNIFVAFIPYFIWYIAFKYIHWKINIRPKIVEFVGYHFNKCKNYCSIIKYYVFNNYNNKIGIAAFCLIPTILLTMYYLLRENKRKDTHRMTPNRFYRHKFNDDRTRSFIEFCLEQSNEDDFYEYVFDYFGNINTLILTHEELIEFYNISSEYYFSSIKSESRYNPTQTGVTPRPINTPLVFAETKYSPTQTQHTPRPVITNLHFSENVRTETRSFEISNDFSPSTKPYFNNSPDIRDPEAYIDESPISQFLSDPNSEELINNKIVRNLYKLRVPGSNNTAICNLLFLRGTLAVTVNHIFYDVLPNTEITISREGPNNSNLEFTILFSDIIRKRVKIGGVHRDLVYCVFPRKIVPTHPNICNSFLSAEKLYANKSNKCVTVSLSMQLHMRLFICSFAQFCSSTITALGSHSRLSTIYDYFCVHSATGKGDCGAPLVLLDPSSSQKIIGIHAAGYKDTGYVIAISHEEITFAQGLFEPKDIISYADFSSSTLTMNKFIKFNKIDFINLPIELGGNLSVVGQMQPVYVPTKTKLQPSPIHGIISAPITKPALLRSTSDINIYENNLSKYFGSTASLPFEFLSTFQSSIISRFGHLQYEILSVKDSIIGNDIMTPIDRTTSPGIPWIFDDRRGRGKTPYLGSNENWIIDDEDLLLSMSEFEKVAETLEIPPVFFIDQTKDERRPLEKVNQGKTRMFAIGPQHFSILFRKYFGWFDNHIKSNRIHNGSLLGIDPHSLEWTILYNRLSHINNLNSPCMIAGDYSNFDGSLNRQLLFTIFDAIIQIGNVDKNSRDFLIMYSLWTCLVDSLHVHKGVIYQLNHSQPSGNPWTSVINTIYNLALLDVSIMYCFMHKYGRVPYDISDHYFSAVYGDDNIIVCSNYFMSQISPKDLTEIMKMTGHTYTSETKEELTQFRPISEISILKRSFDLDSSLQYVFAPLEADVWLEVLNWDKEKQYNAKITQLFVNADAIKKELSFHSFDVYDALWNRRIMPVLTPLGYKPTSKHDYHLLRKSMACDK